VKSLSTEPPIGNLEALGELVPSVYGELRRMAVRYLRAERPDHTLQPTELVHELYLRLADHRQADWRNRAHFFGIAASLMRRILVDRARRRDAKKRDDGDRHLSIELATNVAAPDTLPVITLDHALTRLERVDPQLARMVELRVFVGLTIEEAAELTGVSPSTAKREWRTAKAWLLRELGRPPTDKKS
jgi:RNA polymerase sigma factor (TIGR02999 family)